MANPFSLVRSITSAFRIELSTMKRDAKRLHRASPEVFGQSFPLQKCQEAVARMRGAKSWNDALLVASKAAKQLPTWFTSSQNDVYEAAVGALGSLDVETREDAACLFRGDLHDSIEPALALWSAEMAWRKVPGLILIDTHRETVQDTALWPAATRLDLVDVINSCRVLDLRQSRCPVALSAEGRDWIRALGYALGEDHSKALESAGVNASLEALLAGLARSRGAVFDRNGDGPHLPFQLVERAVNFARYGGTELPPELASDEDQVSIRHDVSKYLRSGALAPDAQAAFDALVALVDDLHQKEFQLGKVFSQESEWRPSVVLFSADDHASSALASVVHSLYYWRFVGVELRFSGVEPRPVLYVGDANRGALPYWLIQSSMARTILAPGQAHADAADDPGYMRRSTIVVSCTNGAIATSGKKVTVGVQHAQL